MKICNYSIQRLFGSSSRSLLPRSRQTGHDIFNLVCLRTNGLQLCLSRSRSTSSKEEKQKNIKIVQDAPTNITTDCIGPPDPISNIPHMRFYSPPEETDTERKFRLQRMKVLEWNHKFWAAHNEKFFKEKEEYVKKHKQQNSGKKRSLSPEEISVFYKNFLNENRSIHFNYNKEWYKKNITLLWPAFKVAGIRLMRRFKGGSKKSS